MLFAEGRNLNASGARDLKSPHVVRTDIMLPENI